MIARFSFPVSALLLLWVAACDPTTPGELDPGVRATLNQIAYGEHTRHRMDVVLPAGRDAQTAFVLFIHGGFWTFGNKDQFAAQIETFADSGFATATMNYRRPNVNDQVHDSELMEDVGLALSYIREHATEWDIAAKQVGLVGYSAGGHLSLLYGYAFDQEDEVKVIVSLAGPTDLTDPFFQQNVIAKAALNALMGFPLEADTLAYQQASPLFRIGASLPPSLLIHGQMDQTVPVGQSMRLADTLAQLGTAYQWVSLPEEGHGLLSSSRADSLFQLVADWLNLHL